MFLSWKNADNAAQTGCDQQDDLQDEDNDEQNHNHGNFFRKLSESAFSLNNWFQPRADNRPGVT